MPLPTSLSTPEIIFVFTIAFLIAASQLKRVPVPGKAIMLFRALFPSWKFFDAIYEVPSLHYRVRRPSEDFQPWEIALEKPKRTLSALFVNPQGNLYLAFQGIVQQLEADIGSLTEAEMDNFSESTSYQLVRNLVNMLLAQKYPTSPDMDFQFKVTRLLPHSAGAFGHETKEEAFLISQTHRVES